MKSINFKQGCILSELGESRLLRAALASEFLAEVLSVPTVNGARTVSAEGAAALVACIAEQLDGVVKETSTIKGDNVTEPVVTFYVLPSGWKEICKGFDSRKVARLCVDAGWLKPGEDGRTQNSIRLPEIGLKRVYQFNTQVLGSAEPE